ncbi:MAG: hypothetical protein IKU30_01125, partial [Clostridia bacterium]|nr:hypothetical protein [Clostridia bacterium]
MTEDCFCARFINLPRHINAVTVLDCEGYYNVYLNANLSYDECMRVFEHEMEHVRQSHFCQEKSVAQCEKEADEKADKIVKKRLENRP